MLEESDVTTRGSIGKGDMESRNIISWRVPNDKQLSKSADQSGNQTRLSRSNEKPASQSPARSTTSKATESSSSTGSAGKKSMSHFHEADTEGENKSSTPIVSIVDTFPKSLRVLMFNANKAIEELYDYCDVEGSELYCQEILNMMLKNTRDFWNLIDRMVQQRLFVSHNATSVSWEIKKPTSSIYSPAPVSAVGDEPIDKPKGSGSKAPTTTTKSKLRASATAFVPQTFVSAVSVPSVCSGANPTFKEGQQVGLAAKTTKLTGSSAANHGKPSPRVSPASATAPLPPPPLVPPPPFSPSQKTVDRRDCIDIDDDADFVVKAEVAIASEEVWAEAEAWIDAEFAVEEAADAAWELMKNWRPKKSKDPKASPFAFPSFDSSSATPSAAAVAAASRTARRCLPLKAENSMFGGKAVSKDLKDLAAMIRPSNLSLNISAAGASSVLSNGTVDPHSPLMTGAISTPTQSSPFSAGRTLHEKLSSPERCKTRNTSPTEAKRRQEAKMSAAESNRDNIVAERKLKAMMSSYRRKLMNERESQKHTQAEKDLEDRLKVAERRHDAYLKVIKCKAENENAKVSEVKFINALNAEGVAMQLQNKLEEVEARFLAAAERRQSRLTNISAQQRKKNSKKAQQMSDLRLHLEQQKMERWYKLQARLEAVQARRENRLSEMSRRSMDHDSTISKDDLKSVSDYAKADDDLESYLSEDIQTGDLNAAFDEAVLSELGGDTPTAQDCKARQADGTRSKTSNYSELEVYSDNAAKNSCSTFGEDFAPALRSADATGHDRANATVVTTIIPTTTAAATVAVATIATDVSKTLERQTAAQTASINTELVIGAAGDDETDGYKLKINADEHNEAEANITDSAHRVGTLKRKSKSKKKKFSQVTLEIVTPEWNINSNLDLWDCAEFTIGFESWLQYLQQKHVTAARKKYFSTCTLLAAGQFAHCKSWLLLANQIQTHDQSKMTSGYLDHIATVALKFRSVFATAETLSQKPTNKLSKHPSSIDNVWLDVCEFIQRHLLSKTNTISGSASGADTKAIGRSVCEGVELMVYFCNHVNGVMSSAAVFRSALRRGWVVTVAEYLLLLCQEKDTRFIVLDSGICLLLAELNAMIAALLRHLQLQQVEATEDGIEHLNLLKAISTALCSALGWLMQALTEDSKAFAAQQRFVWYMFRSGLLEYCCVGSLPASVGEQQLTEQQDPDDATAPIVTLPASARSCPGYLLKCVSANARLWAGVSSFLRANLKLSDDCLVERLSQLCNPQFVHSQGRELLAHVAAHLPLIIDCYCQLCNDENLSKRLIDIELLVDTLTNISSTDLDTFQIINDEQFSLLWTSLSHLIYYLLSSSVSTFNSQHPLLLKSIVFAGSLQLIVTHRARASSEPIPQALLAAFCQLPIKYFTDTKLKNILFPTLLLCYHSCDLSKSLITKELSIKSLQLYTASLVDTLQLAQDPTLQHPQQQPRVQAAPDSVRRIALSVSHRLPYDLLLNIHTQLVTSLE